MLLLQTIETPPRVNGAPARAGGAGAQRRIEPVGGRGAPVKPVRRSTDLPREDPGGKLLGAYVALAALAVLFVLCATALAMAAG